MDPSVRMCDPFEARDFNEEIEKLAGNKCKVGEKDEFKYITS